MRDPKHLDRDLILAFLQELPRNFWAPPLAAALTFPLESKRFLELELRGSGLGSPDRQRSIRCEKPTGMDPRRGPGTEFERILTGLDLNAV